MSDINAVFFHVHLKGHPLMMYVKYWVPLTPLYDARITMGTEGYARKIKGPIITPQIITRLIYKL